MVYKTQFQSHYSYQQQLACDAYLDTSATHVSVWIPNPSHVSTKTLVYGKAPTRKTSVWVGRINIYDPVYIDRIMATKGWRLLLHGVLVATSLATQRSFGYIWTRLRPRTLALVIDLDPDYLQRQKINMVGYRFSWRVAARDEMVAFTSVYFSVLGGAYSSLGKSNHTYAYKAGTLAWRQIKLAQWLQDPVLECKCWLYYAEDMVLQGRFKRARRILEKQRAWAVRVQNSLLMTMCDSVELKWKTATTVKTIKTL